MKLHKIFAIAIALLAFTACSDDEDDPNYNTNGNVSVSMKDSQISIDENVKSDVVNIPINVNGNANGMIKVEVAVTAIGTNPATEDKDFLVTSKTIYIPATKHEGNVELSIVNNRLKENDRTFTVSIIRAEGATVAQDSNTTLVTLVDDDATLYGRLQGTWTFKADGAAFRCKITGLEENEPGFGKVLFIEWPGSLQNESWTNSIRCELIEMQDEGLVGLLKVNYGSVLANDIQLSPYTFDVILKGVDENGKLLEKGSSYFYIPENENDLEFRGRMLITAEALSPDGMGGYLGTLAELGFYSNIKLVRK